VHEKKHCQLSLGAAAVSIQWRNRCVWRFERSSSVMSDSRSWVGRLIHMQGPALAAANERSPIALGTSDKRVVVSVQWQTQVDNLPPGTQQLGGIKWQRATYQRTQLPDL